MNGVCDAVEFRASSKGIALAGREGGWLPVPVEYKRGAPKETGAVLMDDETRKIILVAWQKKKQEKITHPMLGEKMEWGLVPYSQALLLARYLRGDLDAYPPFLWK